MTIHITFEGVALLFAAVLFVFFWIMQQRHFDRLNHMQSTIDRIGPRIDLADSHLKADDDANAHRSEAILKVVQANNALLGQFLTGGGPADPTAVARQRQTRIEQERAAAAYGIPIDDLMEAMDQEP